MKSLAIAMLACICLPGCWRKPAPPPALPRPAAPAPRPTLAQPAIEPAPPAAPTPEPFGSAQGKPPVFEKKVAMRVQAETWMEGSNPYDIGGILQEKLATAGIQVLAGDAQGSDGTLLVEYTESKGTGYSFGGFGTPMCYGTDIDCKTKPFLPSRKATMKSA